MKVNLKIITATMFFLMIMAICTTVQAASAKISASKTTVTAGDKVTITVNINAAAWNLNVSGSGVSGKITGYNADGKNASTTKTYTLTTSSAGTYTVSLIGDITDANDDFSDINKKVTVVANPKSTKPTTPTTGGGTSSGGTSSGGTTTQPKVEEKPTFTSVSKTVYTTGECNLRSSWSTSSSATTVAKGTQLKLTGTSTKTVNGYVWDRVEYNGATKYIANFLLTETKPVEEKKKESDKDKVVKEEPKQEEKKEEVKPQEDNKKLEEQKENVENKNEENTVNEGLKLSELNITGVDFSQGFDPDIYSYELQLNFFVSDLNLTAVANQEDARIEIVGNENFEEGENNIAILVTSADGSETVTYQIKVIVPQEATSLQNNLELYVIGGIAIIVAIIVITIIIKMRNKRKDNEDDGISDFDNDNDSDSNNDNADENDYTQRRTRRRNRGRHSN